MHGHTVIAATEDVDVSGAVSPFERADLGPWLTDPEKVARWDVIIVHKLDRLTRSLRDFDDFRIWCDQHGKTIVSVSESLDLSTPIGRMFASLLATFAQFERERISERRTDAAQKLRRMGAWGGGQAPYGHDAVRDGGQFYLRINKAEADVIREMAGMLMSGQSVRQITKSLNSRGVPSPANGRWHDGTALSILRNPILRGVVTHKDRPVFGDDGMPVRLTEAILTDDEFAAVQARLDANGNGGRGGGHAGASMLYGVLTCACGAPLYIKRRSIRGKPADRYRHNDMADCRYSYTARDVEGAVERHLLALAGDVHRTVPTLIKGKGFGEAIDRVQASIADLDAAFESGDVPAAAYGRMQAKLESKLADLCAAHEAIPEDERDDHIIDEPTGQTYAEHWRSLDDQGRGQFLRDAEIKVTVAKRDSGALTPDPPVRRGWDMGRTLTAGSAVIRIDVGRLGKLRRLAALPPLIFDIPGSQQGQGLDL
jgi:DNA invertase Pin-like site-specific DNA recombinase